MTSSNPRSKRRGVDGWGKKEKEEEKEKRQDDPKKPITLSTSIGQVFIAIVILRLPIAS